MIDIFIDVDRQTKDIINVSCVCGSIKKKQFNRAKITTHIIKEITCFNVTLGKYVKEKKLLYIKDKTDDLLICDIVSYNNVIIVKELKENKND